MDNVSEQHLFASTTVCHSPNTPDQQITKNQSNEPKTHSDNEGNDFAKPLKLFSREPSYLAQVSSLRSEYSEKFEQSPEVTEIKSNGALVKSILAEFEKKGPTTKESDDLANAENNMNSPVRSIENIIEENYMSMTPKKNVLEPENRKGTPRDLSSEIEESPYMEMTHAADMRELNSDLNNDKLTLNEQQTYEVVCFSEGKALEPLYMELNHQDVLGSSDGTKKELPDILRPSQDKEHNDGKSDSSDADDEASKDLDSLDTPSHPRFSLSDSFRPASYYLGASQVTPEFQDSSDSELVSPPPIPTSPPPMNDLDNNDESITSSLSLNEQSKKSSKHSKHRNYSCTDKDHDSSSMCTINTDTENKYDRSQNSDSEVEICMSSAADYEHMFKRQMKAECFSKKESECDMPNQETVDAINRNMYHDYENLYIAEHSAKLERQKSPLSNVCPSPKSEHTRENSRDTTTSGAHSVLSFDDFVHRSQSESNASVSAAEIAGLLQTSTCSTPTVTLESSVNAPEVSPVSLYFHHQKENSNSSFIQPAPYYYSDLSMNTSHTDSTNTILMLNNQRESIHGSKRDITHIVNPIRCNTRIRNYMGSPHRNAIDNTFKLAVEARSVSVDFLNLADKSGQIDKKNIYESDTLKRMKAMDSVSSLQSNPETRNLFPCRNSEKFNTNETSAEELNVRRSHSLEGLLENVLNETAEMPASKHDSDVRESRQSSESRNCDATEGSYLWEEDSVWRERLRTVSQRHTKSLDDLDCVCEPKKLQKKHSRGITRLVTYVNDNVYNMPVQDKQQKDVDRFNTCNNCKNNIKNKDSSFIIDREKLRQWDLMSSAPSDAQTSVTSQGTRVNNTVVACDEENQQNEQQKTEDQGNVLTPFFVLQ